MNLRSCVVVALVASAALALAGCADQQPGERGLIAGLIVLEGEHRVPSGESRHGTLLLLGGSVVIEETAQILGPAYVIGGRLDVSGRIRGDLTVLDGEVELRPGAAVAGDLAQAGGSVVVSPKASVAGETISQVQVPSLRDADRPTPARRALRVLFDAVVVATVAYALARFRRGPVERVATTATRHSAVSLAVGALVGVVGLVLLVLIAFTILLIPVALLGGAVLIFAVAYGWIALGYALGQWLRGRWPLVGGPPRAAFVGAALFMVAINGVTLVPMIGELVALIFTLVGFGAVLLTRFGLQTFVPASYSGA